MDESLFVHDEDRKKMWILGTIDTTSKECRLDIVPDWKKETFKTFIFNHIIPEIHMLKDSLAAYSFMDDDDSVYTHKSLIYAKGDFWFKEKVLCMLNPFGMN